MKRNWKIILIGFCFLFILPVMLFLTPIGPAFLKLLEVAQGITHTKVVEAKLASPSVYEPVARTLATYCQSDQSLFPEYLNYAWLPKELEAVGHGRCTIKANGANVEMGGDLHHFGYRLVLVSNISITALTSNTWYLYEYSEGSKDKPLMALLLAKTQQVTAASLGNLVTSGLDEKVKKAATGPKIGKTNTINLPAEP